MAKRNNKLTCSFCGRGEDECGVLIPGPDANICVDCVQVCSELIAEKLGPRATELRAAKAVASLPKLKVPKPVEIKTFLDQYVIGHDQTKKMLSVAVHNHYKRLTQTASKSDEGFADVEIEKSNILMIGPTGCGKTLFARTLAKMLDVPFAIADATTLTEAGYVGEDVENILLYLIQAADGDISRAERGIVYVDEIDKIARKTENVSITRDVSGEGVQQALLKILEGTDSRVPPQGGRKHPQQEYLKINTRNILFICGGAFVGLDAIIKQREGRRVIGYKEVGRKGTGGSSETSAVAQKALEVQPEDLIRFGLIPEFVGRLPVIASMAEMTEDDLVRVLTEPKNCLVRQYQKLLAMEGIQLTFEDAALRAMAQLAMKRKTGARGLRAVMEAFMMEIMYTAPGNTACKEITITAELVRERCGAE